MRREKSGGRRLHLSPGASASWCSPLVGVLAAAALGRAAAPATTPPAGLLGPPAVAAGLPSTRPAAATRAASRPQMVDFQPGVRIDWARRQVEADATVILREGGIELFACSPQTREHESIVRAEARPLHLFQALGLIGLSPGHPIRFNAETRELQPATGDPVEITIRYPRDGVRREEPIERWMKTAKTGKPVEALPWVFAGSLLLEDGSIAADFEGTLIAVVDFASALIALPELHSDRNEELWLEPEPAQIPPEQTRCTLIFRPGPWPIELDAAGRARLAGRTVTLSELARAVRRAQKDNPDLRIRVGIDPRCPPDIGPKVLKLLKSLTVADQGIAVVRHAGSSALLHDPQALADWLRPRLSPAGLSSKPRQDQADSPNRLADDLRGRTVGLRARAEGVITFTSQLTRDLQSLLSPRRSRPAASHIPPAAP